MIKLKIKIFFIELIFFFAKVRYKNMAFKTNRQKNKIHRQKVKISLISSKHKDK